MTKPVLTIGMIVKNEIRCLERCLKALTPLREALPCELIIADTGSDDGTREVAERYADEVFDFVWANDFAAARNAVMDKARGEWYFSLDADEYLDENIEELVTFLQQEPLKEHFTGCSVVVRNYADYEMELFADILLLRLVRMDTGLRYAGSIHETWPFWEAGGKMILMKKTILHHDGYVGLTGKQGAAKRQRNLTLLKADLEKEPEVIWRINQCIESSVGTSEQLEFIYRGLDLVRKKKSTWEAHGAYIFKHAVNAARWRKLPEFWDWVEEAKALFPQALATRFNVNMNAFYQALGEEKDEAAIAYGEAYFQMVEDYETENFNQRELLTADYANGPAHQALLGITLSDTYCRQQDYERSRKRLEKVDLKQLTKEHAALYLDVLLKLQARSGLVLDDLLVSLWEEVSKPGTEEKKKKYAERLQLFMMKAEQSFMAKFREEEEKGETFIRHGYTLFGPLLGRSELGSAAHIMEAETLAEMGEALSAVESWERLPAPALAKALEQGFDFPPQPLHMEELDVLAYRLTGVEEGYLQNIAVRLPIPEKMPDLSWVRALLVVAVQTCQWDEETDDDEQKMLLLQQFAALEAVWLPYCYAPECLNENGIRLLPMPHRFGWYLLQAFEAKFHGDHTEYIRLLRKALAACESMKGAVEFLLRQFQQEQERAAINNVPPELLALAEQVKMMLSMYPPEHPAVVQIKASPAYRQVAFLLEGEEAEMR